MVAIFFPRRLEMAAQAAANSGDRLAVCAAWFMTHRSQAEPCSGDVPVPDGQVRAAHGGSQPGPAGQLAGAGEPADIADLGEHHQGGELPDAGQRPQDLDPRIGLGAGVQLAVDPLGQRDQAAGDGQAAGDDLPRRRGQDPARPASRGRARTR